MEVYKGVNCKNMNNACTALNANDKTCIKSRKNDGPNQLRKLIGRVNADWEYWFEHSSGQSCFLVPRIQKNI
ncbi:hypothetical protein [Bacillus sp. ISL-39]|uniref:hypothetical protein n=1 Tax=Bacillus sp. ISL-39 TaxID=2819124 RepID=UPI001BEA3862|nr:hypothetical protein [Bacillus sp. ISL-39]MBT2639848.1 hypothetical protein [Bacillus sp. ISL-39]